MLTLSLFASLRILLLVRNFVPAHEQIERGDWNVAEIARNAFDLEGKVVGTIGAGRIGYRVLQRLVPFDCKELLYFDYAPLPEHAAKAINCRRVESLEEMLAQVSPLSLPLLSPRTEAELLFGAGSATS